MTLCCPHRPFLSHPSICTLWVSAGSRCENAVIEPYDGRERRSTPGLLRSAKGLPGGGGHDEARLPFGPSFGFRGAFHVGGLRKNASLPIHRPGNGLAREGR
uniref:Uncharacterized protein n=1 Tax=Micrurus carvalhoi TaxID=3147026 RepID=A0A2H6MXH5_9SAUR